MFIPQDKMYVPYVDLVYENGISEDIVLAPDSDDIGVSPPKVNDIVSTETYANTAVFYPAQPVETIFTPSAVNISISNFTVTASGNTSVVTINERDDLPPLIDESFFLAQLTGNVQSIIPGKGIYEAVLSNSFLLDPSGGIGGTDKLYGAFVDLSGVTVPYFDTSGNLLVEKDPNGQPSFAINSIKVYSPRDLLGYPIVSYWHTQTSSYIMSSPVYDMINVVNCHDRDIQLIRFTTDEKGIILEPPFPTDTIDIYDPSSGRPFFKQTLPDGRIRLTPPLMTFKIRHVASGRIHEVPISPMAQIESYGDLIKNIIDTYLCITAKSITTNLSKDNNRRITSIVEKVANTLSKRTKDPEIYDSFATQVSKKLGTTHFQNNVSSSFLASLPKPYALAFKTTVRFNIKRSDTNRTLYEILNLPLNFRVQ